MPRSSLAISDEIVRSSNGSTEVRLVVEDVVYLLEPISHSRMSYEIELKFCTALF